MARTRKARDYKAEYARRIERGRLSGLTRAQARGHPRRSEPSAAELRQLRRAAAIPSPGEGGPKRSWTRHRAAEMVASLAGVDVPGGVGAPATLADGVWGERKRAESSAERFVEKFIELRLGTAQEAYTLWFSP